ncbi:MAG: SDR family oxidoreductase [Chloroflexia bacterium]|nr:SDR family oxidoreductase [Chloroflexia bacterium]
MEQALCGKVAIITGGASGIGRGISELLAANGASVVITWHQSEAGAAETIQAIESGGGQACATRADLSQPDEAKRVAGHALDRYGQIDVLVANSGGLLQRSSIEECSLELWNQALAVNLTGTFLSCQSVLPEMKKNGAGAIVTVSSLAAHDGGGAGSAHYATAKGGVLTFTRALAKEVGPFGIRVNSVAPGLIGTQFHDRFSTPEGRTATVGRTPLGREGTPADVAAAVLFLASDQSSFVTGEMIEVNGGQGLY